MSDPIVHLLPLFRVVLKGGYDHVYTTDANERTQFVNAGGKEETSPGQVLANIAPGTVPLYRATNGSDFLCTTSLAEYETVLIAGYKAQKHAGYIFPTGTARLPGQIPLFRAYNPSTKYHFYTTNRSEMDTGVNQAGYKEEAAPGYLYFS